MTNKVFGNIGTVLMLLFVLVIDIIVIDAANGIQDFPCWFMVMCIPATITPVVLYYAVKQFGLTDRVKQFFMNIFN